MKAKDKENHDAAYVAAKGGIEQNYDTFGNGDARTPWYMFEGFSCPDIFIEGDDYIIIGEGKWTEPNITTKTSYLPVRNQMVRHIQAALNYAELNNKNKKVYAFYIVDEKLGAKYLSKLKKEAFEKQLGLETIKIDAAEKEKIAEAFLGYTTWQKIEEKFEGRIVFKSQSDIDAIIAQTSATKPKHN